MTPKEAHRYVEDLQRMLTQYRFHFSEKFIEANGVAVEALEKTDKYRWHDLRKNPNDLPPNFHTVVICLKGFEGLEIGVDLAMHNTLNGLWGTNSFSYKDSDVIAWKEIEPFEEVEE